MIERDCSVGTIKEDGKYTLPDFVMLGEAAVSYFERQRESSFAYLGTYRRGEKPKEEQDRVLFNMTTFFIAARHGNEVIQSLKFTRTSETDLRVLRWSHAIAAEMKKGPSDSSPDFVADLLPRFRSVTGHLWERQVGRRISIPIKQIAQMEEFFSIMRDRARGIIDTEQNGNLFYPGLELPEWRRREEAWLSSNTWVVRTV